MNHTITSPKDHTFIFISLQKEEKKKQKTRRVYFMVNCDTYED